MAVAFVSRGSAQWSGNNTTIDTTGATLLVVWAADGAGNVGSLSDSKGNTWTPLPTRIEPGSFVTGRFLYCVSPTVGTGHVFTLGGPWFAWTVWAFSGVASYHSESGNTTAGTQPIASGSVTPSANGALILAGMSYFDSGTPSVAPGFTTHNIPKTGSSVGNMSGWLVQTTAAAINPTWSWTGTLTNIVVATAVFLPSASAAPAAVQSYVWMPV